MRSSLLWTQQKWSKLERHEALFRRKPLRSPSSSPVRPMDEETFIAATTAALPANGNSIAALSPVANELFLSLEALEQIQLTFQQIAVGEFACLSRLLETLSDDLYFFSLNLSPDKWRRFKAEIAKLQQPRSHEIFWSWTMFERELRDATLLRFRERYPEAPKFLTSQGFSQLLAEMGISGSSGLEPRSLSAPRPRAVSPASSSFSSSTPPLPLRQQSPPLSSSSSWSSLSKPRRPALRALSPSPPRVVSPSPSPEVLVSTRRRFSFDANQARQDVADKMSQSRQSLYLKEDPLEILDRVQKSKPKGSIKTLKQIDEQIEREELQFKRFVPLSPQDTAKVDQVLRGRPTEEKLTEKFNIDITRAKISCLQNGSWLNDEIINFYMNILIERNKAQVEKYNASHPGQPPALTSYFFNSFFIEKLLNSDGGYRYDNVKRWSRRFDTFAQDKIFFPINLSNTHWTIAVAFMTRKEIVYFDSMHGSGTRYLEGILNWIVDEGRVKKSLTIDKTEWTLYNSKECPRQQNGYDCGVFTIMNADFLSDDFPSHPDTFSQSNMPFFRRKIAADILRGELTY